MRDHEQGYALILTKIKIKASVYARFHVLNGLFAKKQPLTAA